MKSNHSFTSWCLGITLNTQLLLYTPDLVVQGTPTPLPLTCVGWHIQMEVREGSCSIQDQVTVSKGWMISLVFIHQVMTLTVTIPTCRQIYLFELCCLKSNQAPNLLIRFQTWWCMAHLHPSSLMYFSLHQWMDFGEGSGSIQDQANKQSKNFYLIMATTLAKASLEVQEWGWKEFQVGTSHLECWVGHLLILYVFQLVRYFLC